MRKIKFRAKSKLTNEWLYSCMILQTGSPNVQFIARLDENHKINLELIKPETLGEFTSLQDADGKDIYEGDILKHLKNRKMSLLPIYDYYEFIRLFSGVKLEYSDYKPSEYRIVGNIHDNPELLKEVD